jgi:hypothetical protein
MGHALGRRRLKWFFIGVLIIVGAYFAASILLRNGVGYEGEQKFGDPLLINADPSSEYLGFAERNKASLHDERWMMALDGTEEYEDMLLKDVLFDALNLELLLSSTDLESTDIAASYVLDNGRVTERMLVFSNDELGEFYILELVLNYFKDKDVPIVIALHGHGSDPYEFRDKYGGRELSEQGYRVIMPFIVTLSDTALDDNLTVELIPYGMPLIGFELAKLRILHDYIDGTYPGGRIGMVAHSGGSVHAMLYTHSFDGISSIVIDYQPTSIGGMNDRVHCQYIPRLAGFEEQVNLGLNIPNKALPYGLEDPDEIIGFFDETLK